MTIELSMFGWVILMTISMAIVFNVLFRGDFS